jgi:hypothetical protein
MSMFRARPARQGSGQLIFTDPAFFTLVKYPSKPFRDDLFYGVQKLVLFATMS